MDMVYCRGCGKKIHVTAPTCPFCGAPQGLPAAPTDRSRNVVVLVFVALGWTLVFWMAFLFLGGMIAGMTHLDNPQDAGREFGRVLGGPLLLMALSLSGLLTTFGKLPGTKKPS